AAARIGWPMRAAWTAMVGMQLAAGSGAFAAALPLAERAAQLYDALGDSDRAIDAYMRLGMFRMALGSNAAAIPPLERALELLGDDGDARQRYVTLFTLGGVYSMAGDHEGALKRFRPALKLAEEQRNWTDALSIRERTANLLRQLGRTEEAVADLRAALELSRTHKVRVMEARVLRELGAILRKGRPAAARRYLEDALKVLAGLNEPGDLARTHVGLARLCFKLGDTDTALDHAAQARRLAARTADARLLHEMLLADADLQRQAGRLEAAARLARSALVLADREQVPWQVLHSHWQLGLIHLKAERIDEALHAWRQAVAVSRLEIHGLADEQAVKGLEMYQIMLDRAASVAALFERTADALFFVESTRAGALREALDVRRTLGSHIISADLRAAEEGALRNERAAYAAFRKNRKPDDRRALLEAQQKRADVIARIQREAKAAADIAYPKPASLAAIRAQLAAGEVLVVYALLAEDAIAIVIRHDGAQTVTLGAAASIEDACAVLTGRAGGRGARGLMVDKKRTPSRLLDPRSDPAAAVAKLHKLVIAPLGLAATDTRLLISPDGALSYIPFMQLARTRVVAYVPSATTYGVLRDDAAKRGSKVLALGDPDYGAPRDAEALAALRGGVELTRLPGTREEAKAAGDVVLLGKEATESAFAKALGKRPRWRAVHLACHGLINPEEPLRSSLALSPAGDDDGFLTTLDVFRLKIPADLVVLSACETARGKAYKAEGVVGFTRAFMMAGAPRVIVSLWQVDDEATRSLMVKFYELWKPGTMSTATALKKAQAFVSSQNKWKHPYYWAAWQLWGRAD
ncbi:MAG: CHAT domain-containing protein, partial [Planctomycetota bacterium]|nr:CHAT domain-containing protein [Planctomycetota bacterium]